MDCSCNNYTRYCICISTIFWKKHDISALERFGRNIAGQSGHTKGAEVRWAFVNNDNNQKNNRNQNDPMQKNQNEQKNNRNQNNNNKQNQK